MKLYFSIIATLVLATAAGATECPKGHTRSVDPDGTIRLVYATGLVTTISPKWVVDHRYEFTSEEQRTNTLTYCNLGPSTPRMTRRSVIVSPTGQVTGYIITK